jgi:autotransporter-associated beta strand protein
LQGRVCASVITTAALFLVTLMAHGAMTNYVWTGAVDTNWINSGNWNSTPAGGSYPQTINDNAILQGNLGVLTANSPFYVNSVNINSLMFNGGGWFASSGGNKIEPQGSPGILINASGVTDQVYQVFLEGNTTFLVASNSLLQTKSIGNKASICTFGDASGTNTGTLLLTGSSATSNWGLLVASGIVNLNRANAVSSVTISNGSVLITANNAVIGGNPIALSGSTAILNVGGNTQTGLSGLTLIAGTIQGGGYLDVTNSSSATSAAVFQGNITLGSLGDPLLTLTTANASGFTKGFDLDGGTRTLIVNSAVSLPDEVWDSQSSGAGIIKAGAGVLILSGVNAYTGGTTINAGTLELTNSGTINTSTSLGIAAGATLDVSGLASPFNLSGTTLSASGTGTAIGASAAAINGVSGGTINLGSGPIALNYDGLHPALYISQGNLQLNGNTFTINTTNGSALAPGAYTVIQQAGGNVSGSGTYTVSGNAIDAESTGKISVSGSDVILTITNGKANPIFSNLTSNPSIAYGTTNLTLSGTVSAAGPVYPSIGETVTVTINGIPETTTIMDSTGDFSAVYNSSTIPASGTIYTISYSYAGDASLNSAGNNSTTLTVNKANSMTTLTSSSNPSTYGQGDVTFTAMVADNTSGSKGQPTGSVQFQTNGVNFGTAVVLSGGSATSGPLPPLPSGSYLVTADYTGDANFNASISGGLTQVIQQARGSFPAISSSENPSGFKDSIYFTAIVETNGVIAGNATGTVVFQTNGVAMSTNSVLSGNASSITASTLPRGTNKVAAIYSGDVNYMGNTNILSQTVTNHPPMAATATVYRPLGMGLTIPLTNLATNWSDVDGDTVQFIQTAGTTANGLSLNCDGVNIYVPAYTNNDSFTYTIQDGQGGTNNGTVNVLTKSDVFGLLTGDNTTINSDWSATEDGIHYDEVINGIPYEPWIAATQHFVGNASIGIQVPDGNDANGTKQRFEYRIISNTESNAPHFNNSRYCGFAFMLSGYPPAPITDSILIWQGFQGSPWGAPAMLKFGVSSSAPYLIRMSIRNMTTGPDSAFPEMQLWTNWMIYPNRWYSVGIFIQPCYNNSNVIPGNNTNGNIKLWIDGVKYVDWTGTIGYDPAQQYTNSADGTVAGVDNGFDVKDGIYAPDANNGHTVFFDEIAVGTNFSDVYPVWQLQLASSWNPASATNQVDFAATLPSDATGTIQFTTNGVNFGSPVGLVNGVAVSSSSAFSAGAIPVAAIYSGDTNYPSVTNALIQISTNLAAIVSSFGPELTNGIIVQNGTITLSFFGVPQNSYTVQMSTNLVNWINLETTNAPASGIFQYSAIVPTRPAGYFRLKYNSGGD